jgi:hypothetical protein
LTAPRFPEILASGLPVMPLRLWLRRLAWAAVLAPAGSACLCAQIKVTGFEATSDVAPFYSESTWDNLRGLKRLTTPLVNLSFVTDSGFRLTQRDETDRALPTSLRLAGLQPADFQEIADAVLAAFVTELKAQGIEVLPYEPLAVNPGFQELAYQAPRSGKEQDVPQAYQAVAGISGARKTMTLVGRHCPWVESFMLGNFLAATRLTRELDATLPIVSFLVEFVAYSGERTTTYDWHEFLPAGHTPEAPPLRARPQILLSAGSAAFLTPDGQSATLTLTTAIGYEHAFVAGIRRTRGRDREERKGGSYEVTVDPAAYKQAVIDVLKPQVVMIARKLAAGRH